MRYDSFETEIQAIENKRYFIFSVASKTYEKFISFLTHWWFCTKCLSFLVLSSIPRISVFLDVIIMTCIYIDNIDEPGKSFNSTFDLISFDIQNYSFCASIFDLMVFSYMKSLVLFYYFAFKHQKLRNHKPLILTLIAAISLTVFSIVKLAFLCNKKNNSAIIFSIVSVWVSMALFFIFRRNRSYRISAMLREKAEIINNKNSYKSIKLNLDRDQLISKSNSEIGLNDGNFETKRKLLRCSFYKNHFKYNLKYIDLQTCRNFKTKNVLILSGYIDNSSKWKKLVKHIQKDFESSNIGKIAILDLLPDSLSPDSKSDYFYLPKPSSKQKIPSPNKGLKDVYSIDDSSEDGDLNKNEAFKMAKLYEKRRKDLMTREEMEKQSEMAQSFEMVFSAMEKAMWLLRMDNVIVVSEGLYCKYALGAVNSGRILSLKRVICVSPDELLNSFYSTLFKTRLTDNVVSGLVEANLEFLEKDGVLGQQVKVFSERASESRWNWIFYFRCLARFHSKNFLCPKSKFLKNYTIVSSLKDVIGELMV